MNAVRMFIVLLATSQAACATQADDEEAVDPGAGGKDDSAAGGDRYAFAGRFRLFNSLDSQEGELRGSFVMTRPIAPQIESRLRDVEFELALDADGHHPAYTLASVSAAEDHAWVEWRTTSLQMFIYQNASLAPAAEGTVLRAGAGAVKLVFYPYCNGDVRDCHPGLLSGFNDADDDRDWARMRLQQLGAFRLARE
jgi:hypothetical protein